MKSAQSIRSALAVFFILAFWLIGTRLSLGVVTQVHLNPDLDRFGSQIGTVQLYKDDLGWRSGFGIYDTGASVVTWSAADQASQTPVPIKVPGGAAAEGIGGILTGDVSEPGEVWAVGMRAFDVLTLDVDLTNAAAAFVPGDPAEHGVQMFVGTPSGSGVLPTITGTPIHNGRLASAPNAPNGIAAKIDMQWGIDLGALVAELLGDDDTLGLADLFQGVVWPMPDVEFVAPNTKLQPVADDPLTVDVNESTTAPLRIPLTLDGLDNHQDPGDTITASYNPFQKTGVVLSDQGATIGNDSADRLTMLFDTGASLSIVSTDMAADLGLDLATPEYTVEVQGAAGSVGAPLPGFTLDSLELPVDNDGDGVAEGKVLFTNVPVFVFDVTPADADPEGGLDGILGMNLFNTAREMIYDPFDPLGPSLNLTFLNDPYYEEFDAGLWGELDLLLDAMNVSLPQSAGSLGIPGLRGGSAAVPEPSTLALLAIGAVLLGSWRLRRRRAA